MDKREYFLRLADYAGTLFDALPIELEPKPISYALGILKPEIDARRVAEIGRLKELKPGSEIAQFGNTNTWQGLNSIGMLMDRFTILLIREWCLRNKLNKNEAKADAVFKDQTMDIIEAMVHAAPGSASLNSKITTLKQSVAAEGWEDAFFGLLTINLVLWESQEVLYIKDIKELPCEELRAYIDWFSKGNIVRNEYIQLCEELFWKI